jgi:hypothetical protein
VKAIGWLLMVVGVATLALAAALRHALQLPGVVGMVIPGLMVLIFGVVILGLGRTWANRVEVRARVASAGVAGTALVTGIGQTGVWINENPQCRINLNVSIPGRAVYQATITEVVAQVNLAQYAPGATYSCRVDPDDLGVVVLVDDSYITDAPSPDVLARGVPALATVTGTFNAGAQQGLALRVAVSDGRPTYDVRIGTFPPRSHPPLGKGAQLAVRVDAEDPRRVAVDWANTPIG